MGAKVIPFKKSSHSELTPFIPLTTAFYFGNDLHTSSTLASNRYLNCNRFQNKTHLLKSILIKNPDFILLDAAYLSANTLSPMLNHIQALTFSPCILIIDETTPRALIKEAFSSGLFDVLTRPHNCDELFEMWAALKEVAIASKLGG